MRCPAALRISTPSTRRPVRPRRSSTRAMPRPATWPFASGNLYLTSSADLVKINLANDTATARRAAGRGQHVRHGHRLQRRDVWCRGGDRRLDGDPLRHQQDDRRRDRDRNDRRRLQPGRVWTGIRELAESHPHGRQASAASAAPGRRSRSPRRSATCPRAGPRRMAARSPSATRPGRSAPRRWPTAWRSSRRRGWRRARTRSRPRTAAPRASPRAPRARS